MSKQPCHASGPFCFVNQLALADPARVFCGIDVSAETLAVAVHQAGWRHSAAGVFQHGRRS